MSAKIYKAGIVGCADIAEAHAQAYSQHPRTELAAIADIDPDALESFASDHSVPADGCYPDHMSMLKESDLDLVSVCTWHASHAEITIDTAEMGTKGIICEKPMSTSLGAAREMLKAAEGNGVKLSVEHNRRYSPVNEKARELIADGEVGKPQLVFVHTKSGLLNWGTHVIDQVRYILGDPETEWVIGQTERKTDRHERNEPIEDRCLGQICFAGGVRLNLESDLPGPEPESGTNTPIIYGTEGQMVVGSQKAALLNGEGHREITPGEKKFSGLTAHIDELLDWIEGRRDDHRCSGTQAYRTVEIMMAIYESLRIRGLVKMPLITRANPLKEMLHNGELPVEKPGKYDIRLPYWE